MKTLAIETSCDDTSLAIVNYENGFFEVEKNILYSQISKHNKFGGIIPELASRLHEEKIIDILKEIKIEEIKKTDFISYTKEPGLPGSLLVGRTLANSLSVFLNKEKNGVNHIHGHIFSILCERNINKIKLPFIVLTVSGGHNDLYVITPNNYNSQILNDYLKNFSEKYNINTTSHLGNYTINKIGFTLDDASGETFDKVSRMLGGPYPGGRFIGEQALKGCKSSIELPRIYLKKNEFNFSFSGLKAQCNYKITNFKNKNGKLSQEFINNFAYEFQEATIETLGKKLLKASNFFDIENIALVGGVSANKRLKNYINNNLGKYNIQNFYTPAKNIYSTDNAAMIGVAGIVEKI